MTTAESAQNRPLLSIVALPLALFGIWVIWGSTYLATHILLTALPPYTMAGLRFLVAGSILFVVARSSGAAWPCRKQWMHGALNGSIIIGLGTGLTIYGQQWNGVGIASVIGATGTVWIALLAGVFGKWPKRWEWIGVALGILGVILLFVDTGIGGSRFGFVIGMLGTFAWSIGSILSTRLSLPDGVMRSAAQMLAGSAVMLTLSALLGERMTLQNWNLSILVAFGYAVFASIAGFGSYMWLLARERTQLATSYAYMNPLVALLLGAGVVGERISGAQVAGVAVIVVAVLLTVFATRLDRKPD
jgi:drug/metabolite transporter (DMT)-like permease